MDLFALAESNIPLLEDQFRAILAISNAVEVDKITRFIDYVQQNGRVTVNLRQMSLLGFLSFNKYLNTYEEAQVTASLSGKGVDDILKRRLRLFYEKRIVFDSHFNKGQEFRYGALNAGGIGATNYGNFCAVFKEEAFSTRRDLAIVFLEYD